MNMVYNLFIRNVSTFFVLILGNDLLYDSREERL